MSNLQELIAAVHKSEEAKMGIAVPFDFEGIPGTLAYCEMAVTKAPFAGNFLSVGEYTRISYNLETIEACIKSLLITKRARQVASKYVVLHTVRHELRHAWQSINNKDVLLETFNMGVESLFRGHGEKPAEKDANEYAEAINVGEFNVLLESCTLNQLFSCGTLGLKAEEANKLREVNQRLLKLNAKLTMGWCK